jgi:hypothetical protein
VNRSVISRNPAMERLVGVLRLSKPVRNLLLLVLVAVGLAVVQLAVLSGRSTIYTHDEVVYLSQFNPAVPAYFWGSHRALGMPILVAPVSIFDAPVHVVRAYLIGVSNVGLFLAYWPWLRVRNTIVVPIAAGLFGTSYVAVHQAALALPNYYTALGAVAATAFFIKCARYAGSWRPHVGLMVALAATAVVRPSDSIWLTLPLAMIWLGVRAWRRWRTAVAVGVGLAAGWTVWVVESFARFGGPLARMADVGRKLDVEPRFDLTTVKLYARMWSTGHLECYVDQGRELPCLLSGPIRPIAFVWLIVAVGLVLLALVGSMRVRLLAEVAVPVLAGLGLSYFYMSMLRYGAGRFLLPAGALLAVPVAYGVWLVLRARSWAVRAVAVALAAVVVLGQIPLHRMTVAGFVGDVASPEPFGPAMIRRLSELGVTPPCYLTGDQVLTISYQLRCDGPPEGPFHASAEEPASLARARKRGESVAVIVNEAPPAGSYLDSWQRIPVDPSGSGRDWSIFVPHKEPAHPTR